MTQLHTLRSMTALVGLVFLGCAHSSTRDDSIASISERLCVPVSATARSILYVTPADAPTQCVEVRIGGSVPENAIVHSLSCDQIGLLRDGGMVARPIDGLVVTAEGTAAYLPSAELEFDLRVTIVAGSEIRVVHATGTASGGVAPNSGCYARPGSP